MNTSLFNLYHSILTIIDLHRDIWIMLVSLTANGQRRIFDFLRKEDKLANH